METNNVFYCGCGNTTSWKRLHSEGEEFVMCEICKQVYKVPSVQVKEIPLPPLPPRFVTQTQQKSFFERIKDKIKEKREVNAKLKKQREEEQLVIEGIKSEARQEAFRELKPELIKKFKEEEFKRLTGQDKKDKLQKFADAFKLSGEKKDVAELMTGKRNTNIQQQDTVLIGNDKITKMMDIGSKTEGLGTNTQIDKMLKRKKKYG